MFDSRKLLGSYSLIKQHVRREVKERRTTYDPRNIKDLLDLYLSQEKSDFKDINEENLICILSEMFLGGTYTNGVAVRWILLFMINHPEVQQKCQQEIHKVLGDTDTPALKHMKDLIYVQATINECLRLKSVGTSNMIHAVDEDMELAGYYIPKGGFDPGYFNVSSSRQKCIWRGCW